MIKFQCDICGSDKSRVAFNLIVSDMDLRYETNTVVVCKEKTFLLCQECYSKLNLPNIYLEASKGE